MNKIICDVCGTDYPETAAQCPICGCVSAGAQTTAGNEVTDEEERAYTPVKGGRYSKSNVRKRLKENQVSYDPVPDTDPEPEYEDDEEQEDADEEEQEGSNRGLIIVVIILMVAILAVSAYIAVSIFGVGEDKLPIFNNRPAVSQTDPTTTAPTTEQIPVNTGVACTDLTLSDVDIYLKSVGNTWQLNAVPVPENTTDVVVFTSTNEDVVTVDEFGLVTAVGNGSASITVTCGDITVDCPVLCGEDTADTTEPTETPEGFVLALKSKDFTLKNAGDTFVLYEGKVSASDITWTTDNAQVVTIKDGVVTAVGNGRTRVYGTYGDQKVSCWVSCKLPEEQTTQPDDTTDPDAVNYRVLVNGRVSPFGDEHNAEVTIAVDEEFRLTVENEAGVRQDVTWKASKEGICTLNGKTVVGASQGKVTLTTTIGGQTLKCIIIVK